MTPAPFNVRTRVHEYGGGTYTVVGGVVYFPNFADQRIYRHRPGESPEPVTPEGSWRYAEFIVDPKHQALICVREDHSAMEQEAINALVGIRLSDDEASKEIMKEKIAVLRNGNDFYSSPRFSPYGESTYLTWNHPNMPWDGCELLIHDIKCGKRLAGGENESIFQPEFAPDGSLYFISDRSGWWNLYRERRGKIKPVCQREAEFGRPQWVLGMSTYAIVSEREIVCSYNERGVWHLARLDVDSGQLTPFDLPFTDYYSVKATPQHVVCIAGSPTETATVIRVELATGRVERLHASSSVTVDPGYLSVPEAIEFPTENGQTAHAFLYRPANKDFVAPPGEKPPLLVCSHGGPTGACSSVLKLSYQYWTSRGFAVLDVNYGGSTGYGRAYRERLNGNWGIVDVDDCVNGARYLVERGLADQDRLAIRGGSAGGYTTLAVLAFRDYFRAGASYYGVSDLTALAKETHKFESRYLDRLVGPYPERKDLYDQRSPLYHADRLSCPVILFQGLEDKVVLPNQSEMMAAALRAKGVPVAYVPFPGEQHGFRKAENIKRSLEAELFFYGRIFRFVPADAIEPVPIDNLPE